MKSFTLSNSKVLGTAVFMVALSAGSANAQVLQPLTSVQLLPTGENGGLFGPGAPLQGAEGLRSIGLLPVSDFDETPPDVRPGSGNPLNDALESLNGGGENSEPLTGLLPPIDVLGAVE